MLTDLKELSYEALQQTYALWFKKAYDRWPTSEDHIEDRSVLIRRINMIKEAYNKL
jgi:hypothetical protein